MCATTQDQNYPHYDPKWVNNSVYFWVPPHIDRNYTKKWLFYTIQDRITFHITSSSVKGQLNFDKDFFFNWPFLIGQLTCSLVEQRTDCEWSIHMVDKVLMSCNYFQELKFQIKNKTLNFLLQNVVHWISPRYH